MSQRPWWLRLANSLENPLPPGSIEWLEDALRRLPDRQDLYEFERLHPTTPGEAIGFLAGPALDPITRRVDAVFRKKAKPPETPLADNGLPPPEPESLGALAASAADAFTPPRPVARIPDAPMPTWDVGGAGTISVPGGEEALARIRQQAQEWMARQGMPDAPRLGGGRFSMGSAPAPPQALDLSMAAAPPLKPPIFREGARFPAREIHEDWGGISEREELARQGMREEIANAQSDRANSQLLTMARAADIQERQESVARAQGLLQNAAKVAHSFASKGAPANDPAVMNMLAPYWDELAAMGAVPARFPDWSTFYAHIQRNYGTADDTPPIPTAPGAVDWKAKDAKYGLS